MEAIRLKPAALGERVAANLVTAVLVLDEHLRLLYINPAAEELLSVSAQKAGGLELDSLVSDGNGLPARIREAVDTNRPFTVRDLKVQLSSGDRCTADCSVTPLSLTGRHREVLVELHAVDRQHRISREGNLLAQHQAAHDLIRRLAHEIKNPLGGLRGAAQLLEKELERAELAEYTGIIIGEADRLQSLVDRLLGPNQLPNKQPVNIHQVIEHVCKLISVGDGAALRIHRDYDPSIPDLVADSGMLIQAVLNIARNAIQAMKGDGELTFRTRIERSYTIAHQRHKLTLQLDVIDTGPGIQPELIDTIFYPMVTGSAKGTGLGLSIAQTLVHCHGGLIECSSEPGNTVFSIFLPLETSNE